MVVSPLASVPPLVASPLAGVPPVVVASLAKVPLAAGHPRSAGHPLASSPRRQFGRPPDLLVGN